MIKIEIHQTLPTTLFYYTIEKNGEYYDGDAFSIEEALECVKHNLGYNFAE